MMNAVGRVFSRYARVGLHIWRVMDRIFAFLIYK